MVRAIMGRRTKRGASMAELLVAMLVLLVGIWVVAAKFPKLSQIMRGEGLRDKMARKAEQRVENAKDDVVFLPTMVAMYDPALAGPGNPYGLKEDTTPAYDAAYEPDWDDPLRPPNAVENMITIIGETFRAPAPGPNSPNPSAPYFFEAGPAERIHSVYQPIPLTRDDHLNPAIDTTPYPGTFYARASGDVRFVLPDMDPQGNPFNPVIVGSDPPQLEVTYAWVDGAGIEHWMHGELVNCAPAGAADGPWTTQLLTGIADAGGGIVPDSVSATFRYKYERLGLSAALPPPGTPTAWYDDVFGHALWFDATERGKTLCVDYRVRTYVNPADPTDPDNGRRIPFIREVHRIIDDPSDPVAGTYDLALGHRLIEDQISLFTVDLGGAPLGPPYDAIHVIAFDLETGDMYSDADGTLLVEYQAEGDIIPGWSEGRIQVTPLPPPALPPGGRELLFYYRNLDRETVQLQRAPASFVEDIWSGQSPPPPFPEWAIGRWYYPTRDGASYDPTSPTFRLPNSTLSQTVRVEYIGRAGRTVELHTLGFEPPAVVVVDDPDVSTGTPSAGIISVSGVSVKGFATWLNRGRLRKVDVETLLTGPLEPSLARGPHATVAQP